MIWGRHRAIAASFAAAAVATAIAGTAFACTNLASINLSSTFGKPGDAIVVTGSGFSGGVEAPMEGMDMAAMDIGGMSTTGFAVRPPVVLRWNGADGPILSTAIVDKTGSVSVTINIPDTQPGHYTLMAIQKNAQGYDVYGTPARAPVEVTVDGAPPRGPIGGGVTGASSGPDSGTIILLTVGLGALGLGLFAAGGIAAVRQLSRRKVPAAAKARTD